MSSSSFSRIADYFRVVARLHAEEDVQKQRAIAELLGLVEAPAVESKSPVVLVEEQVTPRETIETKTEEETKPRGPMQQAASRLRFRRKSVEFVIETVPASAITRPAWLNNDDILDPPPDHVAVPAKPEPLLAPRSSRAILSTAMATRTETNQLDVLALLDGELRGAMPARIPRRVVPSLARGIQVLVDRGPSAAPFTEDQRLLIDQIRAVGGREMISVVDLDPSREFFAASGEEEWADYFARYRPLPRVAVVLVSDLGIARVPFERTASTDEWVRFLSRLRAGGNPIVAFVPFAPSRWPRQLQKHAALVQWDRRTTVHSVRRALRRSLA